MSNYNPFCDVSTYTGTYDLHSEQIPTGSSFANHDGERCVFVEKEVLNDSEVVNHIKSGQITPLDERIVSLVATFGFITTKQLNELLTLMEFQYSTGMFKSSLERIQKHGMVYAIRFEMEEKQTNFQVYLLNKNGSHLASVLKVSHTYVPFAVATYPWDVKKVLATNQIMLAYLKSSMPLDWMKRETVVSTKNDPNAIVRPSLVISTDGDIMMYEVVRSGEFWKNYLRDKLQRYRLIFEGWETNNWQVSAKPNFIIAGETLAHNLEIAQIASEIGVEVMFTEDLLQCGSNFYRSVYEFSEDGKPTYYTFESTGTA